MYGRWLRLSSKIHSVRPRCLRRRGQPHRVHRHQGAAEEGPDDGQDSPLRPGLQGAAQGADPGRARGVRLPVQRARRQAVRRDLQ